MAITSSQAKFHLLLGTSLVSNITMSLNKLVGSIPKTAQFQTQSASSFEENLGLCGLPLDKNCGDVDTKNSKEPEAEEEEEEEDGVLSSNAASIGLAPGFILGLTMGYIVITLNPQLGLRVRAFVFSNQAQPNFVCYL